MLMTPLAASWRAFLPAGAKTPRTLAMASAAQNELADGYDPRRDPEKDLAVACTEAQESNKNIFVEVGSVPV
jgi:hypothetical protein